MASSAATDGAAGSTGPQPQTGQENPLASANGALELAPWECINAMIKGAPLCKFGRRGDPHYRNFALSPDGKYLTWYSHKKSAGSSRVLISDCHLTEGQQTTVFRRQSRPDFADVSFSLLYGSGSRGGLRSLDIVCKDRKEYDTWVRGLKFLTTHSVPAEAIKRKCGDAAAESGQAGTVAKPKHSDITSNLKKKLADTNDVYTFGFNGWGQLGLSDENTRHSPQLINQLLGKAVKQVSCGGDHSGAVTDTGEVYMWGNGANGRLGLGIADTVMVPTLLSDPESRSDALRFKSVCCGAMHTLGITQEGLAYSWGCNSNGQLGHGDHTDQLSPTRIALLAATTVSQVDAGFDFSCTIDSAGVVYTWGNGRYGVLGHGDEAERTVPTKCTALAGVRIIATSCGDMHMAAVNEAHEAYTWGWNGCGQLGHGDFENRLVPTRVEGLGARVSSIACGASHSAATVYGDDTESWLYGWGAVGQGQLGHKQTGSAKTANAGDADTPSTADSAPAAAAAQGSSADTSGGAAAGSSTKASDGDEVGAMVALPRVVDCMRGVALSHVSCGAFHTAALTESGVLYMYGDGQFGQLGHGKPNTASIDGTGVGAGAGAGAGAAVGRERADTVKLDAPSEQQASVATNTLLTGPQPAINLDNKVVRHVSCGARHTCVSVATMWINDEETKTCMRCSTTFTTFVRRHHCRNCGGIFCGKCSSRRRPLLKLGFINPVRVCEGCYHRLQRSGS